MTRDLLIGLVSWALIVAVGVNVWISLTGVLSLN